MKWKGTKNKMRVTCGSLRRKEQNCIRHPMHGYFTVEASLLLPAVLFLFVFLFYLTFFLYNRCVLTQDAYVLAFRGSLWRALEAPEVKELVERQMHSQPVEKYVALGHLQRTVEATAKNVNVHVQGGMRTPRQWQFDFDRQADRACPVRRIRRIRKLYHTYQSIQKEKAEKN